MSGRRLQSQAASHEKKKGMCILEVHFLWHRRQQTQYLQTTNNENGRQESGNRLWEIANDMPSENDTKLGNSQPHWAAAIHTWTLASSHQHIHL